MEGGRPQAAGGPKKGDVGPKRETGPKKGDVAILPHKISYRSARCVEGGQKKRGRSAIAARLDRSPSGLTTTPTQSVAVYIIQVRDR